MPSSEHSSAQAPQGAAWGLGLDAGGSATRWALVDPCGQAQVQGELQGLSGLMLGSADGRRAMTSAFAQLAQAIRQGGWPAGHAPLRVLAGFTGLSDDPMAVQDLREQLAAALQLQVQHLSLLSDVALAYDALLPARQGILLYAGTGSIAVQRDAQGQLQRAGGRGYILDDAGGGYWLAREALRQIWRAEDAQPGAWRQSRLARCVFEQLGSSDWARTRECVYQGSRGDVGLLSLAVARAARVEACDSGLSGDSGPSGVPGEAGEAVDEPALALLRRAGQELAAVAQCLLQRMGSRRVVLAGRVFELHPVIENSLRAALPADVLVQRSLAPVHLLAALQAAGLPYPAQSG